MIKGTEKMEKDLKDGRWYSSGCCLCKEDGNNEQESKDCSAKRARTQQQDNNTLTRTSGEEYKCGGKDHTCISSLKCPWKGQSQQELAQNYAQRLQKKQLTATTNPTSKPTGDTTKGTEKEQSTSKYLVQGIKSPPRHQNT
jgi:hypothetical protein